MLVNCMATRDMILMGSSSLRAVSHSLISTLTQSGEWLLSPSRLSSGIQSICGVFDWHGPEGESCDDGASIG